MVATKNKEWGWKACFWASMAAIETQHVQEGNKPLPATKLQVQEGNLAFRSLGTFNRTQEAILSQNRAHLGAQQCCKGW